MRSTGFSCPGQLVQREMRIIITKSTSSIAIKVCWATFIWWLARLTWIVGLTPSSQGGWKSHIVWVLLRFCQHAPFPQALPYSPVAHIPE